MYEVGEEPDLSDPSVAVSPRPRVTRGPFSGAILLLVATGVVVALVWMLMSERQVPVLVAGADLPAYHELNMNDLTIDVRTALDGEGYATVPVEGRLTLKAIKKGEPLLTSDVSPSVRRLISGALTVVGLDVSRADVLGGALRSGDLIQVLLVQRGRPSTEVRAVVLSASEPARAGADWSLVLAMNERTARRHAALLAESEVVIFKDPTASVR
ncbi:hypothetical protein Aph01nite_01160 [Acrocarpospora phusangensis]|uniref:SAF domain-containing protein n=1 Tax=Acrocarpospora phusangensis TaxID=1070424 RepID=A0A919Q464_9ACTN|nr:SAF domain-containing protein [Acrocarpospora phusangensis]GIH21806.1 hypothetical protein Aph01nite_01160 [Acrocarpospora phusangensis]